MNGDSAMKRHCIIISKEAEPATTTTTTHKKTGFMVTFEEFRLVEADIQGSPMDKELKPLNHGGRPRM